MAQKLSETRRVVLSTKPVNNPGSSTKLSGMIFDLSKKLEGEELDKLAKIMDQELGSDLIAPIKAD